MVGAMKKWSNSDDRHLYEDCWNGKSKCNLVDLEQWLKIVIVLFPFLSRKNMTNKSQITIPNNYSFRVKVNLEATNASNNL